jgi:hypothetical protein
VVSSPGRRMTDSNDKFRRLFLDDIKLLRSELDRIWVSAHTLRLGHAIKNDWSRFIKERHKSRVHTVGRSIWPCAPRLPA